MMRPEDLETGGADITADPLDGYAVDMDVVDQPDAQVIDPVVDELGLPEVIDDPGLPVPPAPSLTDELPGFDTAPGTPGVAGDPWSEMQHWHQQEAPDTCAVASQEFVLDSITGIDHSEAELVAVAEQNGWYTPGGGTPLEDTGKVLEAYGIGVERGYGGTIEVIEAKLAAGEHVIVGVDADEIWTAGGQVGDDSLDDFPGIPGQDANHAVEVIGIDRSDPDNPQVVLNDPGHPEGRGLEIPASEFSDAWADSDHFMMSTTGGPAGGTGVAPASLGGYHNADGTYHWTSTGEDTWVKPTGQEG